MPEPAPARPAEVRVRFRRMRFEFEERGFDRYWHAGSPFISMFWSQFSAAFEPGERFFIESARALRDRIDDPALLEELREFCRQEGHHSAHHLRFDRINAEMGVDVDGCRRRYAWVLGFFRTHLDPMGMLAVTTALEHFTAGLAHQYLENPHVSKGADPNVKALWAWHAAEEVEHKATCYDVYRKAGGGELRRIAFEPGAWSIITALALLNTLILLHQQDKLADVGDLRRGLAYLFGRRGAISSMLPSFTAYLSPRFHPWRNDNSALLRRWRSQNQRFMVGRARVA